MERKLLKLLEKCKNIRELKQTHHYILIHGLQSSTFALPKLLSLSAELISINHAIKVFENSPSPNVVAYNTMIKCFIKKTHKGALRIYNKMKELVVMPNSFTLTTLLRCFESVEASRCGVVIHGDILKLGFGSNVFVQNTLLDFYAKCGGNLNFACQVFDEMLEKDVVSWNSMICGYMGCGEIDSAVELFEEMPTRNTVSWNSVISGLSKARNMELASSFFERMPERNEFSWNSMISGYVRIGDVTSAQLVFDRMPEKTVVSWTALITGYNMVGDVESASRIFDKMPFKNAVCWNAMIAGYVHNHLFDQALILYREMLLDGKCRPDQTTLISILSACSHLGAHEQGKWIDSYIKKNTIDLSLTLGNALIDMYAKCGDLDNAEIVFSKMSYKCIITWTTMVSGLAFSGRCLEALNLFHRMCRDGIKPDDVVFIAVLSACTHGGLVEEGKELFNRMVKEFDIKPRIEHFGCIVDLLGRAGRLEEALRFIESMHLKPNAVIWATLLSSCKTHGNGELLERVTRKIMDQDPLNSGYMVLISNLSASIGQWNNSMSYRIAIRQQGMEKHPGCSSIQVGDMVHEFLAKDTRHEHRKEVYCVLNSLNAHLKAPFNSVQNEFQGPTMFS